MGDADTVLVDKATQAFRVRLAKQLAARRATSRARAARSCGLWPWAGRYHQLRPRLGPRRPGTRCHRSPGMPMTEPERHELYDWPSTTSTTASPSEMISALPPGPSRLATKDGVAVLGADLRAEMAELGGSLRAEMVELGGSPVMDTQVVALMVDNC